VVVCWRGEISSVVVWTNIIDALKIHGHSGATRVEWLDKDFKEKVLDELAVLSLKEQRRLMFGTPYPGSVSEDEQKDRLSYTDESLGLLFRGMQRSADIEPKHHFPQTTEELNTRLIQAVGSYSDNPRPKNREEAVAYLMSHLSREVLDEIALTASEDDLYAYHQGLGTAIRNTFGLWENNEALRIDCGYVDEPLHEGADGSSHVILVALRNKLLFGTIEGIRKTP
jgi:hypothetical protein